MKKIFYISGLLLLMVPVSVLAHGNEQAEGITHYMYDMMGGGYYWFGFGQLVVWVLAIFGVVYIVSLISNKDKK